MFLSTCSLHDIHRTWITFLASSELPDGRVLETAYASASRRAVMAAIITPRGSAANAVPHNASNPATQLPYIKVVGGNLGQNRGTARPRLPLSAPHLTKESTTKGQTTLTKGRKTMQGKPRKRGTAPSGDADELAEHRVHFHRLFLLNLLEGPQDDSDGEKQPCACGVSDGP